MKLLELPEADQINQVLSELDSHECCISGRMEVYSGLFLESRMRQTQFSLFSFSPCVIITAKPDGGDKQLAKRLEPKIPDFEMEDSLVHLRRRRMFSFRFRHHHASVLSFLSLLPVLFTFLLCWCCVYLFAKDNR